LRRSASSSITRMLSGSTCLDSPLVPIRPPCSWGQNVAGPRNCRHETENPRHRGDTRAVYGRDHGPASAQVASWLRLSARDRVGQISCTTNRRVVSGRSRFHWVWLSQVREARIRPAEGV
jgi:hypothetical protein